MTALVPGANAGVISKQLTLNVRYAPIAGADIDISGFALVTSGKVRGDGDMCFYGQPEILGGALQLTQNSAGHTAFSVDFDRVDSAVEKVALTATIHENRASFSQVSQLSLQIGNDLSADIPTAGMQETALILGEFYRRQGSWKFRCVAQGFAGGLAPLAQYFGVEIAAPSAPAPVVQPPAASSASTVSLKKVTLDKTRSSISLEKGAAGLGEIRINLNWNQSTKKTFFGRNKSIDLDVGCLYELQDGSKGVVQALGNAFGSLRSDPYIELMGDDRTGATSDGEWLYINGHHWSEIRRVLVFAFIYEGAPNWKETDGVITLHVPGHPDVVVRLNEEGGNHGMCAIALLENDKGAVKITRRVDFHRGHRDLDQAYGWGMRWTAGSK